MATTSISSSENFCTLTKLRLNLIKLTKIDSSFIKNYTFTSKKLTTDQNLQSSSSTLVSSSSSSSTKPSVSTNENFDSLNNSLTLHNIIDDTITNIIKNSQNDENFKVTNNNDEDDDDSCESTQFTDTIDDDEDNNDNDVDNIINKYKHLMENYYKPNDAYLTNIDLLQEKLLEYAHPTNYQYIRHIMYMLKNDIKAVYEYRQLENSQPINEKTLDIWFGKYDIPVRCLEWIRPERDFIYTAHGIHLLRNRYLRPQEPIQFCMLRIARLFTEYLDTRHTIIDLNVLRIMYDAVSCGFLHVSSILADADCVDEHTIPGEACRLMVAEPNYDRRFVTQMNDVCNLISLGVGVGLAASTVPLIGYRENGKVHSGFTSFARKLDSCNYLSIYERKPKIAVYIEMHNDTIFEVFELRNPLKQHLENVFFGIMISNHFIDCYNRDEDWYLFPADAMIDNKRLCDFYGRDYAIMYRKFVAARLYSRKVSSAKLMDALVTSIAETGSPYIIWSDNVNQFSNHRHLGRIKTLNLCAEITNYASPQHSSSCTLMSVNFAMYRDFPDVFERIANFIDNRSKFNYDDCTTQQTHDYHGMSELHEFRYPEMSKYAYVMGFLSSLALNNMMGEERDYRELGISPLGVYDMAIIGNIDPLDIVGIVSEALYKGAIHGSCYYSQEYGVVCMNYTDSPFHSGQPQWYLRNKTPTTSWYETCRLMKNGMANSMLTAQAPTATTSMLIGVAESVTLPIDILISRESENGRNDIIYYGLMCRLLNEAWKPLHLKNDIRSQVTMYELSAPFIDQSQSTMFSIKLNRQEILNLVLRTYYAQLKTGIYYTMPKQINETLTIVKQSNLYNRKRIITATDDDINQEDLITLRVDDDDDNNDENDNANNNNKEFLDDTNNNHNNNNDDDDGDEYAKRSFTHKCIYDSLKHIIPPPPPSPSLLSSSSESNCTLKRKNIPNENYYNQPLKINNINIIMSDDDDDVVDDDNNDNNHIIMAEQHHITADDDIDESNDQHEISTTLNKLPLRSQENFKQCQRNLRNQPNCDGCSG